MQNENANEKAERRTGTNAECKI